MKFITFLYKQTHKQYLTLLMITIIIKLSIPQNKTKTKIQLTQNKPSISMAYSQPLYSTTTNFYSSQGHSLGSDFIYDQTYKSYKMKQKFEKDPKYSYFNAVMQMKHKLSAKEQLYRSVFEVGQEGKDGKEQQERRTFYSKGNQSMFDPDTQVVKVQRLKRNSFRIVKQQPSSSQNTLGIMKKHQSHRQVPSYTSSLPHRPGHRSNLSLYQKHGATQVSFQMASKPGNNKSYVELQISQHQPPIMHQTFYQPSNPKPRLDEIMQEYRKMNRHSHYQKSRKSTLPKEFFEKLYQTNRMFYGKESINRKRVSLC